MSEDCVDPEGHPITMRFGSASPTEDAEPTDLVTAADLDLIADKAAESAREPHGPSCAA